MSKATLPNFFVVGAAKSATSSLHYYLNQHPEVFMPTIFEKDGRVKNVKEPRFFVKENVEDRVHEGVWSWEEYVSLFEAGKGCRALGESSVLYLYFFEEAIEKIKGRIGKDTKIIIMLRNPVDRAVSAYLHTRRGGYVETLSFEEALEVEQDRYRANEHLSPMTLYKQMGLYYEMVKAYLEAFDQVHIIIYDDFKSNTEEEVRKVFDFLGVANDAPVNLSKKVNRSGKELHPLVKKVIYKNNNLKQMAGSSKWMQRIKNFVKDVLVKFGSRKEQFELQVETEEYLRDFFTADVKKLSDLLNRDLNFWLR